MNLPAGETSYYAVPPYQTAGVETISYEKDNLMRSLNSNDVMKLS